MSFVVLKPGVQATLQAAPRSGNRHLGVPASGAADPLSMALVNRLVANPLTACSLELPFGMFAMEARADLIISVTGANAPVTINDTFMPMHCTHVIRAGEVISIGAAERGARVYLAVAGGFVADTFLGSSSTCLPAKFGGYKGRALRKGDVLETARISSNAAELQTPETMQQTFTNSFALRCVPGPDEDQIPGWEQHQDFIATRRADRTGIEVTGSWPLQELSAIKPSAPVFPGAVQLTPSGAAYILLPDAQTTGGYPHVLQVAHVDRHLLGQIRPGDRIHFLRRSSEEVAEDLREKISFFRTWLPDLSL